MKNVQLKVTGSILTITIDLDKPQGPSKSGLTTIIGTTSGNQPIATEGKYSDIQVGVNCFKK